MLKLVVAGSQMHDKHYWTVFLKHLREKIKCPYTLLETGLINRHIKEYDAKYVSKYWPFRMHGDGEEWLEFQREEDASAFVLRFTERPLTDKKK